MCINTEENIGGPNFLQVLISGRVFIIVIQAYLNLTQTSLTSKNTHLVNFSQMHL